RRRPPRAEELALARELLDDLAGLLRAGVLGDVRLREDADEPAVLLHDGQAPHLVARHQSQGLVEVLVGVDGDEVRRRDVADRRRMRILALGHDLDRDVAVGDDARHPVAVDDRHDPGVLGLHQLGGVDDGRRARERLRVRRHGVPDGGHGSLPSLAFELYGYPLRRRANDGSTSSLRSPSRGSSVSSVSVKVVLPDNSELELEEGATGLDAATAIGPRLAEQAVLVRSNGAVQDLRLPLSDGQKIQILTTRDSSDPDALAVLRHSSAHLLAEAVRRLYPGVKIAIGPPIENGFYYDFDFPEPIHEEDLERIEEEIRRELGEGREWTRQEVSADEARRRFEGEGEPYKV